MDAERQAAARAFEADPSDVGAAKKLEAALARAGETAEVAGRYRAAMVCKLDWNNLAADVFHAYDKARFCTTCRRVVHRVSTPEEFETRVRRGDCVMAVIARDPEAQGRHYTLATDLAPGFVVETDKKRSYQEAPEVQARRLPCVIEMSQEQMDQVAARARARSLSLEWGMEMMGRVVGEEKHT